MDTQAGIPAPRLFTPHPNLGDQVNHNFIASEMEGGVFLDRLPPGAVLRVETQNRSYTLVNRGHGQALISGHPQFCPEPVLVHIEGSNWGGSMLKTAFIGRGMHLEFRHPEHRTVMTSRIVDVQAD
jgi:hypothetical protein